MADKVADIIEELKKVGSVIPKHDMDKALFDALAAGENFSQIAQRVCVKKGDILEGIYRTVKVHNELSDIEKFIFWQDIIAALNRNGILTAGEADRLIKEVRW